MGHKILVLGDTGSGKSTAARNLDPETTFYINVIGKPLPFEGWKSKYKDLNLADKTGNYIVTHDHESITKSIRWVSNTRPDIKTIIIDDGQYIMSYEFMNRALEKGYDKFSEMGKHMFDVLNVPDGIREDIVTVFLCHSVDVPINGTTRTMMKTIGKMLDEKITVEGLFSVVLMSYAYKNSDKTMKYVFTTQTNGSTPAKSPIGMFEEVMIPNDLKEVINKYNAYQE